MAFAPNDQYLIVETHFGSVRVWRLPEVMEATSKEQVEEACQY